MATTFEAASQSFGTPRNGTGLIKAARRLWLKLETAFSSSTSDTMTPAELIKLADQYESTSPSLAADLRAAALMAQRNPGL